MSTADLFQILCASIGPENARSAILDEWRFNKDVRIVDELVSLLAEEDPKGPMWRTRVEVLAEMGSELLPVLLPFLGHDNCLIRQGVACVLGKIGQPAVPLLLKARQDKDWKMRDGAVQALGRISDPSLVPCLVESVNDEDSNVLESALWALGEVKNSGGARHLIEALENPRQEVRHYAAFVVGEFKVQEGVDGLIKALGDTAPSVRAEAAWALGDLGDSRAVEPLIELFLRENEVLPEADIPVVEAHKQPSFPNMVAHSFAAQSLGRIGGARAVEFLTQALSSKTARTRATAGAALERSRSPEARC